MLLFEAACLAIVALFVAVRARRAPGAAVLLRRLALLAAAAVVGEASCIRAYGFYAYSRAWWPFVDRVPLVVALIWPVVIHSAWDLARHLRGSRRALVPLVAGALVLADASLIEPVAVRAGLWWWTEPGLFGVPPIGVCGWAFFAAIGVALLEAAERPGRWWLELLLPVVAPAATHLLLLATWWGAARWVSGTVPPAPAVVAVWLVGVALAAAAWRRRVRARVPLADMLVRVPPALLFFGLLGAYGRTLPALCAWTAAFAPPYLALVPWRRG